jgi:hypothetical protein
MRPDRSTAVSMRRCTCAVSVTSVATATAWAPVFANSPASASMRSVAGTKDDGRRSLVAELADELIGSGLRFGDAVLGELSPLAVTAAGCEVVDLLEPLLL